MNRLLVPLNALGVLCAAGYSGYATTPSHIPWGGYISVLLFFVALIGPIVREYNRLQFGFKGIEAEYLENRQRPHAPPTQEIIGPTPQAAGFVQKRNRTRVYLLAATFLGCFLLVSDFVYRIIHLPPETQTSDTIRNY